MTVGNTSNGKDPESRAVIGAAMEVHRQLGSGFLESVYQEALALEFTARGIPFRREVPLTILYKDSILATQFKSDFICYKDLIVELKALSVEIGGIERAQVINYLKATGYQRALIINFGLPSLRFERLVHCYLQTPSLPTP